MKLTGSEQKPRYPIGPLPLIQSAAAAALLVLFLLAISPFSAAQQKKTSSNADARVTPEEAAQLEAVVTTDAGTIRFEFRADKAPKHAEQFIRLARSGFYNGSAFHLVIQWSIIQGGDPLLKDA
ncbi:MAG TPA: peptidylprolyl isomerase, partial [Blastocatellia bacterium]|nr:peptidylprolyl isomerase [Blastocatellia bacterium]